MDDTNCWGFTELYFFALILLCFLLQCSSTSVHGAHKGARKNVRGVPLQKGAQGCITSLPIYTQNLLKKIVNENEP